jgi:hypothetical protein
MSLIILPDSIVDICVSVDQSSLPIGFVVFPPTLIEGAVSPDLSSTPLSDISVNDPIYANKIEKYTIIQDISPRSLVAQSLFNEGFSSIQVALHRIQILQVHLEFSIMKQHQGFHLYLEVLNLSGSFIASLREFLYRDFSVQALCLSIVLRDPLSQVISAS